MVRWSGFADLSFSESAGLAFARAAELAETDAHEIHRDAWVIEDRRLTFNLEGFTTVPVIDGLKRFLGLLVLQATSGDVMVELGSERWVRRAAPPSISKELSLHELDDESPASRTIRVLAG